MRVMYHVGDKIFYPMHGAGIIESIQEREMFGETKKYYCLNMPVGDMTLLIPADGIDKTGLRAVIDEKEAFEVIDKISDIDIDMSQNWNKRYRENMLLLKSGDLIEAAGVVKGLVMREAERSLSTGERKMLISAKSVLISELVLATGLTKEEIERLIENKIFTSVE